MKKVKVAFCWCETGIFIMGALPYCETSKESIKEFSKYAKEGFRIDYISKEEAVEKFYKCDCYKNSKPVFENTNSH